MTRSCHLCGHPDLLPLIHFGRHPVSKHYLVDRSDEQPTWPVRLTFCNACGLTQLVDAVPPEVIYDNYVTLSSWKSQPQVAHEITLIRQLQGIGPDATIIEIGCNDGMFLQSLRAAGFKNLLGVDPSQDAVAVAVAKGLTIVEDFLTPALSQELVREHGRFDLVISRQNFEHMLDLRGVVESLTTLLKPTGYVVIEVPNFDCNLRWRDYSLWEEHVNYFTIDTLRYFLALSGIEIVHEKVILFSGEGLFVIGQKAAGVARSTDHMPSLRRRNMEYAARWPEFKTAFRQYLTAQQAAGRRIAVYGAGSRAFCLINWSGVADCISLVVDDQPEKQNRFMPGGRLPIVSSTALYTADIDVCLLAVNTENEERVIGKHEEWARKGEFWSVFPPSDRLLPIWRYHVA